MTLQEKPRNTFETFKRGLTAICGFKRTFPAFVFNSVFSLVNSAASAPLSPEPAIRPLSKL